MGSIVNLDLMSHWGNWLLVAFVLILLMVLIDAFMRKQQQSS